MTAPLRLGLTGSIGMGKSTTAAMFAARGVPVWDADAAVHTLYGQGGAAVAPLSRAFPEALDGALDRGAISRERLKAVIAADPAALARIEAIVHPLVAAHRAGFIAGAGQSGARLVLLDIPLLFETGAEATLDGTITVSAPPEVQRARVLARPGMTEAHFAMILGRQMPDAAKRARSTWVIETTTPEAAEAAVDRILSDIAAGALG